MTGDERVTRRGLRQAAKGEPGGTGRKRSLRSQKLRKTLVVTDLDYWVEDGDDLPPGRYEIEVRIEQGEPNDPA